MVTVLFATVTSSVFATAPVFGPSVTRTVPGPTPSSGVTVIPEGTFATAHRHTAGMSTVKVAVPPPGGTLVSVGVTVAVQSRGGWVIDSVFPSMTTGIVC